MTEKLALVVDDSRVARMTLSKLLQSYGYTIIEQESAEEALKWLSGDISLPDIIFMDVMMPGMDGVSATRELKARPLLKNIPVIVCTGHDSETDTDKARDSGATAVLAKPPAPQVLFEILTRLNQPRPAPVTAPSAQFDLSLVNKIQARLEQHWLPDVLDKFQKTLDAGSQRLSDQKLQQVQAQVLPDLQQHIAESVASHFSRAFEMQQTQLQQAAQNAFEQALADFNLTARLAEFDTLKVESGDWFAEQKQALETELYSWAEMQMTPLIENILEEQLRPKLLAMINAQLAEENAALYELRDLQVAQAHQVSRIQWLALSSLAIGVAVLFVVFVFN